MSSASTDRRISILGVAVDDLTEDEAIERVEAFVASGRPHQVVTVNPEFVMEARRNPSFRRVLAAADLATPDGFGLLLVGLAWSRQGAWRALALAGLAGVALQLALNASLDDWYGGWAFGQRRMTEAYPLLVVGLAWLLARDRRRLVAGAALLCALYGALLLVAQLYYTHTAGHPEGGGIAEVSRWLVSGPHGPTLAEIFRDRYGPWAWARPER